MHIAFITYDGMTALDFVGAFDPITRLGTMELADATWDVVARTEAVTATGRLEFVPDLVAPELGAYDVIVIPGGWAARDLAENPDWVDWVQTAASCDWKLSVCTGALLLGAAGILEGKRATTHRSAFDRLAAYCEVVDERVVEDGDVITSRGVSASVDLGLYAVERLTDRETRRRIQEQMDYPYGGAVFGDT